MCAPFGFVSVGNDQRVGHSPTQRFTYGKPADNNGSLISQTSIVVATSPHLDRYWVSLRLIQRRRWPGSSLGVYRDATVRLKLCCTTTLNITPGPVYVELRIIPRIYGTQGDATERCIRSKCMVVNLVRYLYSYWKVLQEK